MVYRYIMYKVKSDYSVQLNMIYIILLLCMVVIESCAQCTGPIYAESLTENDKEEVVWAHNYFRDKIANGEVSNQPRGINLRQMSYDDYLQNEAKRVSVTCQMSHVLGRDKRWQMGQNIYMVRTPWKDISQNWTAAVESWFNEHSNFTYPCTSTGMTGHYTQVIWADTYKVGCDYIAFYNSSSQQYPYTRLYTCNYGPAGNVIMNYQLMPPYKSSNQGK